jgi:sodium/proline symporter
MCIFAYIYACTTTAPLNTLVLYAWAGLGSSFGPLLLIALHTRVKSSAAAIAGIVTGGLTAAFWPYLNVNVPAIIPAYLFVFIVVFVVEAIVVKQD